MFTNPVFLITAGFYLLAVLAFLFFSLFAVYILIRYGKSRNVALAASLCYGIFFIILLSTSLNSLSKLNSL